jgi:predicted GNAT family N-acyltransferase
MIAVRKVTEANDLEKVFAIRRKVFVEEQHCPPELEWSNEDKSVHFLATYNDEPSGAARWRKTENGHKLERFAVLKEFRGKGIGVQLVKAVLADLPADASVIYLNAQLSAVGFYAALGFREVGETFEEAGIIHQQMVLSSAE